MGDFDTLLQAVPERFATSAVVLRDEYSALRGVDLADQCQQLAEVLAASGGSRVALLASNSVQWVVADLACQIAGLPLLPLPDFFTPAQMRHASGQSGIDLLIVDHRMASTSGVAAGETFTGFCRQGAFLDLDLFAGKAPAVSSSPLPPGTGKITYTSGSTGSPKGVCLGNRQIILQAKALAERVGLDKPRHLCLLPLSVLLENIAGVYTAFIAGGEILVPDQSLLGFSGSSAVNPKALLQSISHQQPNSLILIPQLLTLLIRACEQGWRPPSSLRFIAVGGSKVSSRSLEEARGYGLPVYEGYGLSECASVVSLNIPGEDKPGTTGRPLKHLKVDSRNGELVVSGNPFLGYVADRSSWGQMEIATGDLGHVDSDGYLHLDGRKKNLLITSFGRNISPEWVESELLSGSLIRDCLVVGDGRPWLSALIAAEAGVADEQVGKWLAQVNQRLPDYARIAAWHRLPAPLATFKGLLTATGKPRREAICEHFNNEIEILYATHSEAVTP